MVSMRCQGNRVPALGSRIEKLERFPRNSPESEDYDERTTAISFT